MIQLTYLKRFLLLLSSFVWQISDVPDSYTAAVFENRHISGNSRNPKEVEDNLKLYSKAAYQASSMGADIIVFSEFGLSVCSESSECRKEQENETMQDSSRRNVNPPIEHQSTLATLGYMALSNKIYVVANVVDELMIDNGFKYHNKQEQLQCPASGLCLCNTVVMFDRKGNLIAKKITYAPNFIKQDTQAEPEFVTIPTEFGVFGLLGSSLNSVFMNSAYYIEKYKVNTILLPTHWHDDILPLNAIEWQQAWAIKNKVNLLAANEHYSSTATLGSGIYSKYYGALTYTYSPDGKSKLLIAKVPLKGKVSEPKENDTLYSLDTQKVYNLILTEDYMHRNKETGDVFPNQCVKKKSEPIKDLYSDYRCSKWQTKLYTLSKLIGSKGSLKACHNELCCTLEYTTKSMSEDYYLGAFNGTNDLRHMEWVEETCVLMRCNPLNGENCVFLSPRAKTMFYHVKLTVETTTQHVYPAISMSNNRLVPITEWNITTTTKNTQLQFSSELGRPLVKVVLMGRAFERDPSLN